MKIEADWLVQAINFMTIVAVRQQCPHDKKLPGTDDQREHIDQHKCEQWLILIGGHDEQQKAHATRHSDQLLCVQIVAEKACIPGQR